MLTFYKSILLLTLLITQFYSCNMPYKQGNSKFVNPFIGTGGHGHTYPGASLPFGMVQFSPDTRLEGWDGCSGYHYSDSVIYGFSHTHLSGTGCSDYGDILFMPTVGKVQVYNGTPDDPLSGYCSKFSHKNEIAQAGYYSVILDDDKIKAELTATTRVGIHCYTFPKSDNANIIIDLTHRDNVIDSYVHFVCDNEIEGYRRSEAWAKDQYVYFVAKFSKPYLNKGIVKDDLKVQGKSEANGTNIKAFVNFRTDANEQIVIKVAISGVSIEGARKNLETEATSWDFNEYKINAFKDWDNVLSKIQVEGNNEQKTIFYSALYHTYLSPNVYSDVDGKYRGRDNKIHNAENYTYYTVFSLWDTYRALHPLMTILEPEKTSDFIKTFLAQYEQGGLLPVWELSANETNCMPGYHAVSVIYDAWAKGIRNFDGNKALEAMKASANQQNPGLISYVKNGCVLATDEGESVSKTLEYAYDDWCIAMFAKSLNKTEDYNTFIERAQFYKNVFDDSTGFMRARMNGTWFSPFKPNEVNYNYTEANSWQYSFYVPQDIDGILKLHGGKEAFSNKLDSMFLAVPKTSGREQVDITGLIGQYAHGNEPSHHIAYLYNYAGKPWKSQKIVHEIQNNFYKNSHDGLCGNEDCGQMSAWFIFSSIGFYPVTPGSNIYVIGTPMFSKSVINLNKGKKITVIAKNLSENNFYIQSVKLNGKKYNKSFISHKDLLNGDELIFEMGAKPSATWGVNEKDCPESAINDNNIIPVPYIQNGKRAFSEKIIINIHDIKTDCKIFYTIDGSEPSVISMEYSIPFGINETTTIKAIAIDKYGNKSKIMRTVINKLPDGVKIKISSQYNTQYSAGGDIALIDGIRGGLDFRTGDWQGYQDVNLTAIIDLGKTRALSKIGAGFLQDVSPWILFPPKVEFWVSSNGKDFKQVSVVKNDIPRNKWGAMKKDFIFEINKLNARYIKVVVHKPGNLPEWHPGAGNPAFFFIDEIFFRYTS
ncbi:MAG: hypothetical protein A2X08_05725 [Bacteroidetes bacterium GWA2_32_17]|nr:MAG: hypothetical protein A2X08_05725 [Bacteroidetes bacterium GWA2_32_17]